MLAGSTIVSMERLLIILPCIIDCLTREDFATDSEDRSDMIITTVKSMSRARILEQVTIYRRPRNGPDGHLDQS